MDAVGLALFSVVGTEVALDFGTSPLIAICMGVMTATFGGIARDVLCVAVVGDIDMASADSLDEALGAALGVGGITRVMVDMQRTTFLDSAGVRTLVASRQNASDLGIVFRIMNSPRIVRRVLELSGVYEFLTDDV